MTQATNYLDAHLVEGTSNQIKNVTAYVEGADKERNCIDETSKNGNEVLIFNDESVLVRIDDEAFDYETIEDYRK